MNIKIASRLVLIFFALQVFSVTAQDVSQSGTTNRQQSKKDIVEELNSNRPGQGNVMVYQDEAIKGKLKGSSSLDLPVFSSEDGTSKYVKVRGYKIQVFSGNNQRESKDEAYSKEKLINESFDDLETVVYFKSPRWILRAGNFKTREEADVVLEQIMDEFPTFGKEMYVISDTVKIPL